MDVHVHLARGADGAHALAVDARRGIAGAPVIVEPAVAPACGRTAMTPPTVLDAATVSTASIYPEVTVSGLSRLQRRILMATARGREQRLALMSKLARGEADDRVRNPEARVLAEQHGPDEFYCRLLALLFGLAPKLRWFWRGDGYSERPSFDVDVWEPFLCRTQHFDVECIGRGKYNAAKASLARAITRLEGRHLVDRTGLGGVRLTAAGIEVAHQLASGTTRAKEITGAVIERLAGKVST
jgi:hypothetical protein